MKVKLKNIGKIITGNTPSKQTEEYWDTDDICFVKPDAISEDGITTISKTTEFLSERARSKARIVGKNSILVTCIGSIGKIGLVESGEYAFNQQINAIIPNGKIHPKYLAYALLYLKPQLTAIANAPVVPIINKSQFGEFEITITEDNHKQIEVALALDMSAEIIQKKKDELNVLDNLIKARFVELFGNTDHPKWAAESFESRIYFQEGPGVRKWQFRNDGIKLINIKNVVNDKLDLSNTGKYLSVDEVNEKYTHFLLNAGDYVMASSGVTWGKIAEVNESHLPLCLNTSMIRLVPKEGIIKQYLFYFIKSDFFRNQIDRLITGSAQPNFGPSHLMKVVIPVPPIGVQEQFAKEVQQIDKSKLM